ncbi:MAG TPA: toll/interleukin-1 receptor domain-containing protein [Thermoanaerobaculia bacterium]|nr:toll/interleukin-1 receptor domain-containing protein [Thermoanaerobaculia bacterium]
MATVFISHSSKDRAFVENELIPFLRSHGVTTWYSPDDIRTADEWQHKIREGLRYCEWFLVVISNDAVGSEWVQAEVHWAMENRKQRVVPLILDSSHPEDLHLKLSGVHYIDFRHDRDLAWKQLLNVWMPAADWREHRRPQIVSGKRVLVVSAAVIVLIAVIAAVLIDGRPQRSTSTGGLPVVPATAHKTQDAGALHIQLRDRVTHKMSFSVVSSGSGQFVVERLFIRVHGYADCNLRNEVSVTAAASIPTAYAVHISKKYSEYDLPVLLSAGDAGVWKYVDNTSDEFSVHISFEPYVLFMISIEAEVRSLFEGRSFQVSSERTFLLDVVKGNAGGCLRLEDWYTPQKLVVPRDVNYLEGVSTLARQLLTADLSYSSTYLTRFSTAHLKQVLPELVQVERSHPDNPVFARNREIVAAFVRRSPWELNIRSARAAREVINAMKSQAEQRVLLRPPEKGQTFLVVQFALSNLSPNPAYYDLRDFRLIDSRGHEQKSLGILFSLSPPSVAPGRFFDEPFRVDPGSEATDVSETSLIFAVDKSENGLALRYRDLEPVEFVIDR